MPLHIVRNDITKMKVDAIVNAANCTLLGGGGVDGCIHRAAGPELLAECETLGGCPTGGAKLTGAGKLPCKYVIHAVGPRWMGGGYGERDALISCYKTSLELAREKNCETVAFPLISSGIFGYPKDRALRVAIETISAFLMENEMTVYIVIFDKNSYQISSKVFADIEEYIDDRYAAERLDNRSERLRAELAREQLYQYSKADCCAPSIMPRPYHDGYQESSADDNAYPEYQAYEEQAKPESGKKRLGFLQSRKDKEPRIYGAPMLSVPHAEAKPKSIEDALSRLDEGFSEMLLRKIDEAGMTDAQCYKKANIDRKLFSKIRSDKLYKPSKPTALAFAIALELSLEETKDMLQKAGFALSRSNKFDIIIEYFIENKNYDIFQINEALFAFDQNLLGA